jgi:hypothetical protein
MGLLLVVNEIACGRNRGPSQITKRVQCALQKQQSLPIAREATCLLVGRVWLEHTTYGLRVRCSTN